MHLYSIGAYILNRPSYTSYKSTLHTPSTPSTFISSRPPHSGSLHYNFAAPELFCIPTEGNSTSDKYVQLTARTQKLDVSMFVAVFIMR